MATGRPALDSELDRRRGQFGLGEDASDVVAYSRLIGRTDGWQIKTERNEGRRQDQDLYA